MNKIKVLVHGQVQGVGFRYWVRRKYEKLGIVGEVFNNKDGTVGAEFEGDEKQVKQMLEYFKKGPPLARVDKVAILD